MTPENLSLDTNFFVSQRPLTLYRLARARYSNLSGIGAALAPGRWNVRGQEAIYTSTEVGVPVLERLVHTPKYLIPSNLALMTLRVTGDWQAHENALIDATTGGCFWFYRSLEHARKDFDDPRMQMFAGGLNPFAVAIPSVIVPVWNVVLYPQGVGFWNHVSLEDVTLFDFDARLFQESAQIEAGEEEPSR